MQSKPNVKELRQRLGLSQQALAVKFGVDQATVSRWESYGLPERGPALVVFNSLSQELPRNAGVNAVSLSSSDHQRKESTA